MLFNDSPSEKDLDMYRQKLCESNEFSLQYFQFMSLTLNLSLCIDLILTLRDPFYPSKRRVKFYVTFSMIATAILVLLGRSAFLGKIFKFLTTNLVECGNQENYLIS